MIFLCLKFNCINAIFLIHWLLKKIFNSFLDQDEFSGSLVKDKFSKKKPSFLYHGSISQILMFIPQRKWEMKKKVFSEVFFSYSSSVDGKLQRLHFGILFLELSVLSDSFQNVLS